MRAAFLSALLLAPVSAQLTHKHDTSPQIKKVIQMLEALEKDTKIDMENDNTIYNKFACYCNQEKTTVGSRMEETKIVMKKLVNEISLSKSLINSANAQIKEMDKVIATEKKSQSEARTNWEKLESTTERESKELTETVDVLERAVKALTKPRGESFLETESPEVKRGISFVEVMTGKSVDSRNMGAVTGYLTEMRKQSAVDLQERTRNLLTGRKRYERGLLLSQQAIAINEVVKDKYSNLLAENQKKLGEAEQAHIENKKLLGTDEEYFDSLNVDCDKRRDFYNNNRNDATTELAAIRDAVSILSEGVEPVSFVQMTLSSRVEDTSRAISSVSRMSMRSQIVSLLQDEHLSGSSVIDACHRMIADLKENIESVENEKAMCQQETQRHSMNVIQAKSDTATAQNQYDALEAAREAKNEEVASLNKKLDFNLVQMEKLDAQCRAGQQTLEKQKKTLSADAETLAAARAHLAKTFGEDALEAQASSEVYKDAEIENREGQPENEFKDTRERRGRGASILAMLDMIFNQTSKNLKDTEGELTSSEENCHKQLTEMHQQNEVLDEQLYDLEEATAQLKDEALGAEAALNAATAYQANTMAEQENYGNCAQRIAEFNSKVNTNLRDIEQLETVISHLKNIDRDYAEKRAAS